MTITVSGLGSGLSYDSWITQLVKIKQTEIDAVSKQVKAVQTQETALGKLSDDYEALLSSIESFTGALSDKDVFNQKAATSSSEAVTAAVTSSAGAQDVKVSVSQLATATDVASSYTVASFVDKDTTLSAISEGVVKEGTFSVYVGGAKHTIDITKAETMQNVLDGLNNIAGVSATLSNDGKLTIVGDEAANVTVGSSSDTSNLSKVMSLTSTTTNGVTTTSSSKSIFDTDTGVALTSTSFSKSDGTAAAAITEGKFTIGSATFTVTATSTIDSVIKEINASEDAGVTASWDSNSGKLVLKATDQGAVSVNVQAGDADGLVGDTDASNFTDIMGLTTSTWNSGTGALESTALVEASQKLGTNAVLTINGTQITSASNTVTSDVSGVSGLTLTLNEKTTSDTTVAITQDTTKVAEAVTKFVEAFNKAISETDKATTTDGNLYGESTLNIVRNKLRSLATAGVSGVDAFKNLASIGITSGAIGSGSKDATNQLVVDAKKLTEALTSDPDAVKSLLLGKTTTVDNGDGTFTTTKSSGVFSKLETVLENATDNVKGYFVKREDSLEGQADRLTDKVEKMTDNLKDYESQLKTKFALMDKIIANMQKQASIFDSYFNKDTSKD